MSFWGAASEAANRAFPMAFEAGLRKKERAETQNIDNERWNKQYEIDKRNSDWEQLDRTKKEQFEKGDRLIRMGRQRLLAGDELGAASLWNEAYKNYPDGNEAMIVLPQSNPQYFQQLVQQGQVDPKLAQSKVLVISKQHGIIPFKDMKDLDMMLAEDYNQSNYLTKVKESEARLAEANSKAQLNPVQMENGKWMRESYTVDPNGVITFAGMVPHDGPIPMSEQNKALRALGIDPEGLTDDDKKILAGLQGRNPSPFEQDLTNVELGMRGRAEDRAEEEHSLIMQQGGKKGGLLTPKDRADLRIKYRDQYIQEFGDPMGRISKDAPDRESWIDEQMEKDMGLAPAPDATTKVNPDVTVSPVSQSSQRTEGKPSSGVQEFFSEKTGHIMRVHPNGKQEIIDGNGNIVASRVRNKIPASGKGDKNKQSQKTSPADGAIREEKGKRYVWDAKATNPRTGRKGAWREVVRKGN